MNLTKKRGNTCFKTIGLHFLPDKIFEKKRLHERTFVRSFLKVYRKDS